MVSQFSPPVLYLSDDDDDNETDHNISYGSSFTPVINENLARKKRRLPNATVRINPSIVDWSKRQRNDYYPHQQPTYYSHHYEPETIAFDPDEYNFADQESHSFHAFDWTNEPQISTRIYSNPIQRTSRVSIVPHPNIMNIVEHDLDQSDAIPLIPMHHQNDRYIQHPHRKSMNTPIFTHSPPPLPLPLPTPTSSFARPQSQRIQPGKNIRIPYTHSTPSPPLPVHHQIKPVFPSTKYRPLPPTSIPTPISTLEIRRQPLNGTGILSAFYDSKCYRCNICKFKSVTSSMLLEHLFTHMFFCNQCPFYSHSHHNLYQHIFEKHHANLNNDSTNPKNLDLLYITRCPDGTFALSMDSSLPPHPSSTTAATKTDEKIVNSSDKNNKPKAPKRRPRKPRKTQDNEIVILSEKRDINPQPPSSSVAVRKCPILKEKSTNKYVLMKHRRCYSIRYPPCLHSLTLEYNICREHTIRHMCHTYGILKRRKFKSKLGLLRSIDEVAICLQTVVNHIVDIEENRNPSDPVCLLPNNILNLLFQIDDLNTLTNCLKLNNKYTKLIEQNKQNQWESSVRRSNQHIFILSSTGGNENEQSTFSSLYTSMTNADSIFSHTKLNKLPISYDNTHRFLKGNLNILPQSTNSTTTPPPKQNSINARLTQSKNPEPRPPAVPKPPQSKNPSSASPIVDKNNNSVTSSKSRLSPTPSVIVID